MRFAVLFDGGFVLKRLKKKLTREPTADDIVDLASAIANYERLREGHLLRNLYYDAPPASGTVKHPISQEEINLQNSGVARSRSRLHDQLGKASDFALRLGEVRNQGWQIGDRARHALIQNPRPVEARDVIPNLTQKGVDLRIGLDIARLSLRQLVDSLVLVTGDTDFIPALAFARREGLRVFLDPLGASIPHELKLHADHVFEDE